MLCDGGDDSGGKPRNDVEGGGASGSLELRLLWFGGGTGAKLPSVLGGTGDVGFTASLWAGIVLLGGKLGTGTIVAVVLP